MSDLSPDLEFLTSLLVRIRQTNVAVCENPNTLSTATAESENSWFTTSVIAVERVNTAAELENCSFFLLFLLLSLLVLVILKG